MRQATNMQRQLQPSKALVDMVETGFTLFTRSISVQLLLHRADFFLYGSTVLHTWKSCSLPSKLPTVHYKKTKQRQNIDSTAGVWWLLPTLTFLQKCRNPPPPQQSTISRCDSAPATTLKYHLVILRVFYGAESVSPAFCAALRFGFFSLLHSFLEGLDLFTWNDVSNMILKRITYLQKIYYLMGEKITLQWHRRILYSLSSKLSQTSNNTSCIEDSNMITPQQNRIKRLGVL